MRKSKIIYLISFFILLIVLVNNAYTFIENMQKMEKKNNESIEFCENTNYENTQYEEFCNIVLKSEKTNVDFFTMFTNVVVFGFGKFSFILFLFVSIPSLIYICNYLKNGVIVNDVTRVNYSLIKKKILKKSYCSLSIFPIIILIAFIICALYTKNYNPSYAIQNSSTTWSEYTLNRPIAFMICYLFNIIIHTILYINIGICIARKHHNYFIAVILSFLTFIGIEAILEIGFNGILCTSILNSEIGIIFNIMNMISFNDSYGMIAPMIVPSIITILTFILIHILYKDKEKLIIDCAQNE